MGSNLRRRGAVYWFRRRIPDALRARIGMGEISRSLRTVSASEARARARRAWLGTETLFTDMIRNPTLSSAQAKLMIDQLLSEPLVESPTADDLVGEMLAGEPGAARMLFSRPAADVILALPDEERHHIEAHLRLILERVEAGVGRLAQKAAILRAELAKHVAAREKARAEQAEAALASAKTAAEVATQVSQRIAELASAVRLGVPEQGAAVMPPHHVAPALMQADAAPRGASGPAAGTPASEPARPPVVPAARPCAVGSESDPRVGTAEAAPISNSRAVILSAIVEPFLERRRTVDRLRNDVISQERCTLRLFIEACGDRPPREYGRGDVTGFLDLLRKLPVRHGKKPADRELTIHELVARAEVARATGTKVETLTDKTAKRHLSTLSQFFWYALDKGLLSSSGHSELFHKHRFRSERGTREQREMWQSEELRKLFASPVWKGCHPHFRSMSGTEIIRDARFWLPPLALYQGGRLEEFADLYRRDIFCDDGTWAVKLVESWDENGMPIRRLKTAKAIRNIPLHPEILRMGFLEYVTRTAPRPDDPLFPDLEPEGPDRSRGPRISRWFAEYRKKLEIYREGVGMHAFRHTANTRLRDVIDGYQQPRHVNYIFGHSSGGGEGEERYDKGPGLKAAATTLALLRYPELDFSHLYVDGQPGTMNCAAAD